MSTLSPDELTNNDGESPTLEIRIFKKDAETVFHLLLQKDISFSCFQDKKDADTIFSSSQKLLPAPSKKVNLSIIEQLSSLHKEVTGHITNKIPSVQEAAKRLGLSPSKFKSIFKKIYKEPYYQHFKTQKLKQAKVLIEKEEYSVKEVSELLGYSEPIKFIMVFKKRYKITPGKLKAKSSTEFTEGKKPKI